MKIGTLFTLIAAFTIVTVLSGCSNASKDAKTGGDSSTTAAAQGAQNIPGVEGQGGQSVDLNAQGQAGQATGPKISHENIGSPQNAKPIVIKAYDDGFKYLASEDFKKMLDMLANDQYIDIKEKLLKKVSRDTIIAEALFVFDNAIINKDKENALKYGFATYNDYQLIQKDLIDDKEILQWREKITNMYKLRKDEYLTKIHSFLK